MWYPDYPDILEFILTINIINFFPEEEKVLKKRWSRGDLERIRKGDYRFYALNEVNILSITATVRSDWEKVKKDWLIIKCDYDFAEKNREQLQKIAKNLNTRVVMIFSSNN